MIPERAAPAYAIIANLLLSHRPTCAPLPAPITISEQPSLLFVLAAVAGEHRGWSSAVTASGRADLPGAGLPVRFHLRRPLRGQAANRL
jgi:hypothetical protein